MSIFLNYKPKLKNNLISKDNQMDTENQKNEKITQFCPDCNAIVEAEIVFKYAYNVENKYELQCEGTFVYLAKCLNCEKPILLCEDFTEIEGIYYPQEKFQLFPDKESSFVANAPEIILKPYREAIKCYRTTAYEACVIMCRKGIEAICHNKGEKNGVLNTKLKKLKDKGILSDTFYEWSNELREIGNIGAHSHDIEIVKQDAKDILEFFEALILYLYHLVDKYEEYLKRKTKNS